jgi:NDP-sugar pyrophosphorylase family protein
MILAAGLGTRLRPLTRDTPKALIDVGGVPMIERVAHRLVEAGADRLIINLHHRADQVRAFVESRAGFGVDVRFSWEQERPLETGGGLAAAGHLFRGDAPFFLHNVDVICDADLTGMYQAHQATRPLATLAVQDRPSRRMLRFDRDGLQARVLRDEGREETARPATAGAREWAFAGIHVVSPQWFDLLEESGAYSILTPYLRQAGAGHTILPYDISGSRWLEIGTPERLEHARSVLGTRAEGGTV